MIVSMALSVQNKDGIRAKEGDIIAVKPSGWKWGMEERKRFLLVEVDLGPAIETMQDAMKLCSPLYENGKLEPDRWDKDGLPVAVPLMIGKRRFKIPFADLDGKAAIDWDKVKGIVDYQPLEKINISVTDLVSDQFIGEKLEISSLATKG